MLLRRAIEAASPGIQVNGASGLLARKLANYSEMLASQGQLDSAVNYLGDSNDVSYQCLYESGIQC
jgi:hypothetical protein